MKIRSPTLNSIGWFAPGQGFLTHPAFFENAKRLQTAPDQEVQLPVPETYLIIVQDVCENALAKDSRPKLNCIDWCAPGQGFFRFACFRRRIFARFCCLSTTRVLIQLFDSALPSYKKLSQKSWGWERFALRKLQKKTCCSVQTESFSSWHTY